MQGMVENRRSPSVAMTHLEQCKTGRRYPDSIVAGATERRAFSIGAPRFECILECSIRTVLERRMEWNEHTRVRVGHVSRSYATQRTPAVGGGRRPRQRRREGGVWIKSVRGIPCYLGGVMCLDEFPTATQPPRAMGKGSKARPARPGARERLARKDGRGFSTQQSRNSWGGSRR